MIRHRLVDQICLAGLVVALMITALLSVWASVQEENGVAMAYETRLFDDTRVHTIDITIDDWSALIEEAQEERYVPCTMTIDDEVFRQVGIRAKGNNSLRLTSEYELARYSLKVEFDHYLPQGNYHGLDKLSLDASFQDNSYLKTVLAFDMMRFMGVPTPLCSYAWVRVNGEDWGLFLAVEECEEAFASRNFGWDHGVLYQPDYRSLNDENADVALRYIDEQPSSYPNIFDHAKTPMVHSDQRRLIEALRKLSQGEVTTAVHTDEVLRYFVVQVFVMNWDSYLGHTGHNYILYEEEGRLWMLPWDYNLAFGTYALGMSDPIRDPNVLINYPIDTPAEGSIMRQRPLYHELMKEDALFAQYHSLFSPFLADYFDSGRFEALLQEKEALIAPYVKKDPTAFCSYADHQLAVDTLRQVCQKRKESIQGQLEGRYPSTLAQQQAQPGVGVDAAMIDLRALGDFDDLRNAKERQQAALARITDAK
ncbi:CotH kinase family protein [Amedibacillus dolichus]|uniref:CotH kinase family protein n=1 Tax=Amedibacillus dolichus TaxID=31971 RepID=A0ABT7UAX1_9FIRM|nr:CotH kinase family protein [Amedibacillus dolichus]MDM8156767.1 CotH kinase family protein [Amedibacillus dolichus]